MATASVTNTFTTGTPALASKVNENFTDLVDYLNDEAVDKDGTTTMTGLLTLHSTDPTTSNHATRKSYVDAHDWANVGSDTDTAGPLDQATAVSGTYYQTMSASVSQVSGSTYRVSFFLPSVKTDQTGAFGITPYRLLARVQWDGVTKQIVQSWQTVAESHGSMQGTFRFTATATSIINVRVHVAHEFGSNAHLVVDSDSDSPARLEIDRLGI